jgi:hypothetical protein
MKLNLKTGFIAAGMIAVSCLAWAITAKTFSHVSKPTIVAKPENVFIAKEYDPLLLKKFNTLSDHMNSGAHACTYSGVMNIEDGSDTANTIKSLDFLFCRNGRNCYYKYGNTETINEDDTYLCIDHQLKKILWGKQKDIDAPMVPDLKNLTQDLKGENYSLTCRNEGENQTLTFLNEKHLTCKEYAVSFDTTSLTVNRIYVRLTDIKDPMNHAKEKKVDIHFNSWKNQADLSAHPVPHHVLQMVGTVAHLNSLYKDYELIHL